MNYACKLVINRRVLTVTAPNGATCLLNLARLDKGDIALTNAETSVLAPIEDACDGKGVVDGYSLTVPEMKTLMSIRSKIASAITVTPDDMPIIPAVEPALTEKPKPVIVPTVDGKPITALTNHVIVETPVTPPGERKKRQRKTDSTILELYEDIRRASRAYGVDELERRINLLTEVKRKTDAKYKRMTYDVPSRIRAEIIEPTAVLKCLGFMPTESELFATEEALSGVMFDRFRKLLDRYGKGTPNAARLGCHAKYRITGLPLEDERDLRQIASEALSETLIKAHGDLIAGLDAADKALAEAIQGEKTSNEQEKARAGRDNAYRAEMRAAHEELNRAIHAAEQYDVDENVVNLLAGLRATLASRRNAFNAQQRLARLKGIEV